MLPRDPKLLQLGLALGHLPPWSSLASADVSYLDPQSMQGPKPQTMAEQKHVFYILLGSRYMFLSHCPTLAPTNLHTWNMLSCAENLEEDLPVPGLRAVAGGSVIMNSIVFQHASRDRTSWLLYAWRAPASWQRNCVQLSSTYVSYSHSSG